MKKPLKIILIILAVLVGLVAALLIWLTATQLNVKTETAVVTNGENSTASFAPGDSVSILTWNVGYAGLGEESDFFMDGGKQVRAPSKAIVEKNMDGIVSTVKELDADFTFLQEIEADPSTRSYGIEEAERMRTETIGKRAHQARLGAAVYQRVAIGANPRAELSHCRQKRRVVADARAQVHRDVHMQSPSS